MLSQSSIYAVRALTWLAQQTDHRFHLARDMAEVLGLPAPFLGKVLQPLVARGILHSQRGRSGGFRLARPASDVSLQQVVESQEDLEKRRGCVLGQTECSRHDVCPLHEWWSETTERFFATLEKTSLADMARFPAENPSCRYPLPSIVVPRAPLPSIAAHTTSIAAAARESHASMQG